MSCSRGTTLARPAPGLPKPSRLRFWAPRAEVPVGSEHDVLAAYADGSVRYLHYSGKVAVIDPPGPPELGRSAAEWLAIAGQLSTAIGPWDGALPDVPTGHARVFDADSIRTTIWPRSIRGA
jgi:hypothetical protein